jgi:hypothetical protein
MNAWLHKKVRQQAREASLIVGFVFGCSATGGNSRQEVGLSGWSDRGQPCRTHSGRPGLGNHSITFQLHCTESV